MKGKRGWLALALGLVLLRGLIYAAVIPPWQSPDETGHFEYAWLVAHLRRLPTPDDVSPTFERELLGSLYEWRYGEFVGRPLPERMPDRMNDLPAHIFVRRSRTILGGRFSLAYVWQALFILPFQSQDLIFQLFLVRLSSILLNVGIVWLAERAFRELVPFRPGLVSLMVAVVVFLPQHTFINSMVGEGPLAELMACLVLYCWFRLFRRGFKMWEVVGIVGGTLIGVWSKTTAAFLIPLDIGLALWWLVRRPGRVWTRRHAVYVCIGVVLLGTGIWMWRHSSLGALTLNSAQRVLAFPELVWVDKRGITFWEALVIAYDSFWANFGWMALPVSERWYGAVALLSLAALAGWVVGKPEKGEPLWMVGLTSGTVFTACVIFVWTALLVKESGYYQFQGRYLFPVIIPYIFLLVGGLERLFPARLRRHVMVFLLVFLVCFDVSCLAGYILPYFYL